MLAVYIASIHNDDVYKYNGCISLFVLYFL